MNLLLPPAPAPSPSLAPSLARLRVLRLDFRRAPAAVLAHALRSGFLPALETLGLVHCRLGDAGASELAEALTLSSTAPRQSRHLKCLDLAFNSIGAYGAQALARSCLPLPALEHLRLDGNPLGDAGVMCLVQALRPTPMCGCGGPDSKRGGVATAAGALHHGRVASAVAAAAGAAAPPALALDDTLFIPDRELLLLMVLPSCTAHSQAACVPTLNAAPKLRRLELRRVQLGRSAVLAMVQALCAGGAPELQNLVLGTRKSSSQP